jgi:hypothetical protein
MRAPVVRPHPGVPEYRVKQSRYHALKGLNPLRLWISAPSNSGKSVLISSILLDVMRGAYTKIYLFSPSADLDSVWLPVKRYAREQLGQNQHKEPWYFDKWSDAKLQEIIDEQTGGVLEQKRRRERNLDQIMIVVDDWADMDHLHKSTNSPLATLMCRGRHSAINVILSTQKALEALDNLKVQCKRSGDLRLPLSSGRRNVHLGIRPVSKHRREGRAGQSRALAASCNLEPALLPVH